MDADLLFLINPPTVDLWRTSGWTRSLHISDGGFYPSGWSGPTRPSAADKTVPGGRGGNAAEDGATTWWEEPDLHPRSTFPSTPRRCPFFRGRGQSDADAFGAVRVFISKKSRCAGNDLPLISLLKNKYIFHIWCSQMCNGYLQHHLWGWCAAWPQLSPGRSTDSSSGRKIHILAAWKKKSCVSWISRDFFLTRRNFQRKTQKRGLILLVRGRARRGDLILWFCKLISCAFCIFLN